jgi:CheY-like chemotaxis protein
MAWVQLKNKAQRDGNGGGGARHVDKQASSCSRKLRLKLFGRERETAAVDCANLKGQTILVMEEEVLIALDLRAVLERAGAHVHVVRNAAEALECLSKFDVTAGVVDWRPASEDHRVIARALKQKQVRFLFYATHPPEDVTTVRGAPVFLKPGRPEEIAKALALLTGAR